MRYAGIVLGMILAPAAWARSAGPPIRVTGAAVDGGGACTNCHRTFALNSDPRGSVRIETAAYKPGVKQTVRVTVSHPEALRWGFQLTARRVSDAATQAGSFDVKLGIRVLCAPDGADAPCGAGLQQFAEHNRDSFDKGANGRMVFEMDWTPPAEDVGDIVLFAAGNAADGTGNNAGDRIYTTSSVIHNGNGCNVTAAPVVTGVGNAASGRPGLSFGALVSIYGTGFLPAGKTRGINSFELAEGAFPQQLECVAVEIGSLRAPLTYASPGQINAQVPLLEFARPQSVVVILNPGASNERKSVLTNHDHPYSQPGFFTFNGTSVAALHADNTPVADPSVVPGARPAKPGDTIVLYGTGFGATEPIWQPGQIPDAAARTRERVRVQIGSIQLDELQVDYAGISPGSISGLMQVNIRVPVNLPETGNVTVTASVGGVTTQAGATIPVQR